MAIPAVVQLRVQSDCGPIVLETEQVKLKQPSFFTTTMITATATETAPTKPATTSTSITTATALRDLKQIYIQTL